MVINHNIAALNTYNQLSRNEKAQKSSLEKLSSGMKINSAADDAAGLAISQKMTAQVKGLDQATSNAQNGISLVQTAEGALGETQSILQRVRELAVQSANDTNTSSDRTAIQSEVSQLTSEIDRIGKTTQFNAKDLLNGGAGLQTSFTVMTVNSIDTNWMQVVSGSADTAKTGNIAVTGAKAATGATTAVAYQIAATAGANSFDLNGVTLNFSALGGALNTTADAKTIAATINSNSSVVGATASADETGKLTITNTNVGSASKLTVGAAAGALTSSVVGDVTTGLNATISEATIGTNYIASGNSISVTDGTFKGMQISFNGSTMNATSGLNLATGKVTGNGILTLQIGANQDQTMNVSINDMRSTALGVANVDLSVSANAQAAIGTIDTALTMVSTQRANLGAIQNRLDHTINNLTAQSQNMSAASSQITDVDMAKEMMNYTKNNILNQAAQAMLAQANQLPQGALQLLK
jgi:flagellin